MPEMVRLDEVPHGAKATRLGILQALEHMTAKSPHDLLAPLEQLNADAGFPIQLKARDIMKVVNRAVRGHSEQINSTIFDLIVRAHGDYDILDIEPLPDNKNEKRSALKEVKAPEIEQDRSPSQKRALGLRIYFNTRVCEYRHAVVSDRFTYERDDLRKGREIAAILERDLDSLLKRLNGRHFIEMGQSVVFHFDLEDKDGQKVTLSLDCSADYDSSYDSERRALSRGTLSIRVGDSRWSRRSRLPYGEFMRILRHTDDVFSAHLFNGLEQRIPSTAYSTRDRWAEAKQHLIEVGLD